MQHAVILEIHGNNDNDELLSVVVQEGYAHLGGSVTATMVWDGICLHGK